MITFLSAQAKRLVPYLIAAAMGAFVAYRITDERWQFAYHKAESARMAADNRRIAESLVNANQVLELERRNRQTLAEIDTAYQKGVDDAKKQTEEVVNGVIDGSVRLRSKFTCPPASANLPKADSGASKRDGASSGGLQPEDAAFLIRLAARADEVTKQLKACQDILKAERVNAEIPQPDATGANPATVPK